MIGWRRSKATGETLLEIVIERHFAPQNNWFLGGEDLALGTTNTDNDLEMKREADQQKLHRMGIVHDFWGMWQGSHSLCSTQKESCAQRGQGQP